jgi:hypothetical protein
MFRFFLKLAELDEGVSGGLSDREGLAPAETSVHAFCEFDGFVNRIAAAFVILCALHTFGLALLACVFSFRTFL